MAGSDPASVEWAWLPLCRGSAAVSLRDLLPPAWTSVLSSQEGGDPRPLSPARWNPRELAQRLLAVVEVTHASIKLSLVGTYCIRASEVHGKAGRWQNSRPKAVGPELASPHQPCGLHGPEAATVQPGDPIFQSPCSFPVSAAGEPMGTAKSGDAQPAMPPTPAPRFTWRELRRNIRGGARTSSGAESPQNRAP